MTTRDTSKDFAICPCVQMVKRINSETIAVLGSYCGSPAAYATTRKEAEAIAASMETDFPTPEGFPRHLTVGLRFWQVVRNRKPH